jgi:hypothetical protein
MLAAAWCLSAQQGRQQFDLYGGVLYRGTDSQTLDGIIETKGLVMVGRASGTTPRGGGGYIIEAREFLEFNGYNRLFIRVAGITDGDRFNMGKLLKLELNKTPVRTTTTAMRNRNDPDYINAVNGEAEFDLSRVRNIRSINLVFYDCEMNGVRIDVFYSKN